MYKPLEKCLSLSPSENVTVLIVITVCFTLFRLVLCDRRGEEIDSCLYTEKPQSDNTDRATLLFSMSALQ